MKREVAVLMLMGLCAAATSGAATSAHALEAGPEPLADEPSRIDHAIERAMEWLRAHPAEVASHGVLEVAEEIIFYYSARTLASTPAELESYRREIATRHAAIEPFNEELIETGQHLQGIWGPLTYLPLTHIVNRMDMDAESYRAVVDDIVVEHRFLSPSRDAMHLWIAAYMERLGYTPATPVSALLERSKLRRNPQSSVFINRLDLDPDETIDRQATIQLIYDITHEVFALTDFGAAPPPAEIACLRGYHALLFDRAIRWAIEGSAIDILAELVVSAHLLDLRGIASMPDAIAMILRTQQADGSFGITNPDRPNGRRHGVLTSLLALKSLEARRDRP